MRSTRCVDSGDWRRNEVAKQASAMTMVFISMGLLWHEQERNQAGHLLDSDGVFRDFGQGIIAGVVAERAFVAQRLTRVDVAFDE
jgi:hypothetical protein